MPRVVSDVDTLQEYLRGVVDRAEHHATGVDEVVLVLVGALVWRKDEAQPIEVLSRDGSMANVLWVRISGKRYAFSYNHGAGTIELREGSTHGDVIASFSNSTTTSEIKGVFSALL